MLKHPCLGVAAVIAGIGAIAVLSWQYVTDPGEADAGSQHPSRQAQPAAPSPSLDNDAPLTAVPGRAVAEIAPLFGERIQDDEFQTLAEHSPAAAAALLDRLSDDHPNGDGWTLTLAALWGKNDAPAALKWIETMSNNRRRVTALENIVSTYGNLHLQATSGVIGRLPSGEDRTRLAGILAIHWMRESPEGASRWALQLNDPTATAELLKNTLPAWVEQSPDRAGQFILSLPAALRSQSDVLGALICTWMEKDPAAARTWVNRLTDESMWVTTLAQIAPQLTGPELQSAMSFGSSLPDTQDKDTLLGALAARWGQFSPAEAATFAVALPNEGTRLSTLSRILATWSQQSPLDAAAFVAALSDERLQLQALYSLLQVWPSGERKSLMEWVGRFPPETKAQAMQIVSPPKQDAGP